MSADARTYAAMSQGQRRLFGWSGETWLAFLLLLLHATAFTWYTGQIWEDYFITFKFSQNLAEGRGLTYDGEHRIHGFTSPLGTLLPAFFHWILRAQTYEPALYAYRFASILAYAAAGAVLHDFLKKRHAGGRWTAWIFTMMFMLDVKSVAFSTNGMETGLMLIFVANALVASQQAEAMGTWWIGCLWGGLLWTRPDGCVYVAIFALLQLLRAASPPRQRLSQVFRQAIVAALVYLPWFMFATIYFGSPVPQTVLAKSMFSYRVEQLWTQPAELFVGLLTEVYAPIYWHLGQLGWPSWLGSSLCLLTIIAALAWIAPLRDSIARAASLATCLSLLYAVWIPAFPWYFPPIALLASTALACLLAPTPMIKSLRRFLRWMVFGFVIAAMLYVDSASFYQCRLQQQWIEWGTRKPVADWLRAHVKPEETIFLESLGYIGYFSQRRILDFPGLVTPAVVAARREPGAKQFSEYGCSYAFMRLQPDWLVARPQEYGEIDGSYPEFRSRYRVEHEVDVYPHLEPFLPFPGATWLLFDSKFVIFRRIETATAPEAEKP